MDSPKQINATNRINAASMPVNRTRMNEIGRTGLTHHAGLVYDEFLRNLRGSYGVKMYREMRDNDPIIGSIMMAISQILREARWDVIPSDKSTQAQEDAQLLREIMYGMQHTWSSFFAEILSMLIYGWSLFEIVYTRRPDGLIGWKKIAIRRQSAHERWDFDSKGNIVGFWQRPMDSYELIYIPLDKCIHFRTEPSGSNPEGRSILRNAYRPYYMKKYIEEIEAIGIERDLVGLPVLTMPEGLDPNDTSSEIASTIAAAKQWVSNIRRDEQDGVLLPHGWALELLSSGGTRQFDTSDVINRKSKEIAVSVLAQFVMLGMERTGSYALAKEQTNMFYLALDGWMDGIASEINRQAVRRLFLFNGIDREPPLLVHTPIRRYSLRDLTDFVEKMVKVGLFQPDEDLEKLMKKEARLEEFGESRK